ncbi:hypothetical protein V490_01668 [Pseudogymnoascus sp. VKM F-3557]|nr:hypothetical protein V490_01668 [Pseudogymnoascus sp. VKM F-3557]
MIPSHRQATLYPAHAPHSQRRTHQRLRLAVEAFMERIEWRSAAAQFPSSFRHADAMGPHWRNNKDRLRGVLT